MTHTLNELLFGSSGQIYVPHTQSSEIKEYNATLATKLAASGYFFTNLEYFLKLDVVSANNFVSSLVETVNSLSKEAFYLRSSFAQSTKIEDYTAEDWTAILCQYSIDYGTPTSFETQFLSDYTSSLRLGEIAAKIASTKPKEITVTESITKYTLTILNNPAPLRDQQILILKALPINILENSLMMAKPKVRATESIANTILYKAGKNPVIPNLDGLLRFILDNCQQGDNGEDFSKQILNPMLKTFRFHIPTKLKKFILNYIENLSRQKDHHFVVEQMFSYELFWKRCLKHCHWTSKAKQEKRYPALYMAFTLLYSDDRSWTYNSRHALCISEGRYGDAIKIAAAEKPGTILRSLTMYAKYMKGVKLPVKGSARPARAVNLMLGQSIRSIKNDASSFFLDDFPTFLKTKKPSIKLCWQAVEELLNPINAKPIHSRTVQGITVEYSTPIPAADPVAVVTVVTHIQNYIADQKKDSNAKLGKVFLDPSLANQPVQYSGQSDTSIALSGNYLPTGSKIPLPASGYIRFGVCWKDTGNGSCDIDLSTVFNDSKVVSYSSPSFPPIATSSGDITSCSDTIYSAEFIDINIDEAKKAGFTNVYNILNLFSGQTFDKYDTHAFINIISEKERIISGRSISIDLTRQTHAIQITSSTKKHIGLILDLDKDFAMVVNKPFDSPGINARDSIGRSTRIIDSCVPIISLLDVLVRSVAPEQLTTEPTFADTTIGCSSDNTINSLTALEEINSIIF